MDMSFHRWRESKVSKHPGKKALNWAHSFQVTPTVHIFVAITLQSHPCHFATLQECSGGCPMCQVHRCQGAQLTSQLLKWPSSGPPCKFGKCIDKRGNKPSRLAIKINAHPKIRQTWAAYCLGLDRSWHSAWRPFWRGPGLRSLQPLELPNRGPGPERGCRKTYIILVYIQYINLCIPRVDLQITWAPCPPFCWSQWTFNHHRCLG